MLGFQSRQACKALCSPLRAPPRAPLLAPLRASLRAPLPASRYVHNNSMQAPFHGPPSYDTLRRRFSAHPNPQEFYVEKSLQEAKERVDFKERGDFVDIHDAPEVRPENYDVLITDVTDRKLRTDLSDIVGIEYLSKATKSDVNNVVKIGEAIIWGSSNRTIFPCVVGHNDRAYWVFFIVDGGSPSTYLAESVVEAFNLNKSRQHKVKIAGYDHVVQMSPAKSHFSDINLLGADYFMANNVSQWNNFGEGKAKLFFGLDWNPPTPKL